MRAARFVASLPATDRWLALGLCAAAMAETVLRGDPLELTLALPLIALPLALRRRAPLAMALLAAAGLAIPAATSGLEFDSISPFVAMLALAYSAGAHANRRAAAAGLGGLVGVLTVEQVAATGGDTLFGLVVLGAPWLAGRAVRARRRSAEQLAALTETLRAEQEANARLAVAAERSHVARELHDSVAGEVNVMVVQAAVAERLAGEDRAAALEAVEAVHDSGRRALAELRRMLDVLAEAHDDGDRRSQPGLARLGELAERARAAGLAVELSVSGAPAPLPPMLEASAYRIVQEALTNVVRHAAARRAEVRVRYGAQALEVEVRDDGRGPAQPPRAGHGLAGMRERAALFGGTLEAGPGVAGGFAVRAQMPIPEAVA